MKAGLLAWARAAHVRAVRAWGAHARSLPGGRRVRQRGRCPPPHRPVPVLWLFTDQARLPDPRAAASALPPGLAGIVLRHDADPARAALGRDLARICRIRRIALVVAGDVRLARALRAGVHLREGRWAGALRLPRHGGRLVTSSAHGAVGLRRAARSGADLAVLSPVFPTASHPGAPALGAARWAALAGRAPLPVAALGGVSAATIRRLPVSLCFGVGGIGAMG